MALAHAQVTVTTTATLLSAADAGRDGQTVLVQNPTTGVNVYIGGAGVTTTSYGFLLQAGTAFAIDLQVGEALYGVVASSTQAVGVIRQGV
jgi:hypothetical protein